MLEIVELWNFWLHITIEVALNFRRLILHQFLKDLITELLAARLTHHRRIHCLLLLVMHLLIELLLVLALLSLFILDFLHLVATDHLHAAYWLCTRLHYTGTLLTGVVRLNNLLILLLLGCQILVVFILLHSFYFLAAPLINFIVSDNIEKASRFVLL